MENYIIHCDSQIPFCCCHAYILFSFVFHNDPRPSFTKCPLVFHPNIQHYYLSEIILIFLLTAWQFLSLFWIKSIGSADFSKTSRRIFTVFSVMASPIIILLVKSSLLLNHGKGRWTTKFVILCCACLSPV